MDKNTSAHLKIKWKHGEKQEKAGSDEYETRRDRCIHIYIFGESWLGCFSERFYSEIVSRAALDL